MPRRVGDAVISDEARRGDRVAECAGLENRCTFAGTEGSNPSLSALLLPVSHNCLAHGQLLFWGLPQNPRLWRFCDGL